MSDVDVDSLDFSTMVGAIREKLRLIPLVRATLNDPSFDGFNVAIEGWDARGHDGWWHPSAHQALPPRQLFYYLATPHLVIDEKMASDGIKAVTAGKFWHSFYQQLFLAKGLLRKAELGLRSDRHRLRGHCDGEMTAPDSQWGPELLEIKTINGYQVEKVRTAADLKEIKPEYFAQAQLYLYMRYGYGKGAMRFFFVHINFPFKEVEFVVAADERFQRKTLAVYADVWERVQQYQAGQEHELPEACCYPGSDLSRCCPVRLACPVGANA